MSEPFDDKWLGDGNTEFVEVQPSFAAEAVRNAEELSRLRAEIERLTAERDHYRERFFLAWAALTPVSEDEKRGMARVLAILESKKKSGTGPVKGEFGLKWSGRLQAFEECREMLRLALASLPKESADG